MSLTSYCATCKEKHPLPKAGDKSVVAGLTSKGVAYLKAPCPKTGKFMCRLVKKEIAEQYGLKEQLDKEEESSSQEEEEQEEEEEQSGDTVSNESASREASMSTDIDDDDE